MSRTYAEVLLVIVRTQPLTERIATEHGTKYIILGYIDTHHTAYSSAHRVFVAKAKRVAFL